MTVLVGSGSGPLEVLEPSAPAVVVVGEGQAEGSVAGLSVGDVGEVDVVGSAVGCSVRLCSAAVLEDGVGVSVVHVAVAVAVLDADDELGDVVGDAVLVGDLLLEVVVTGLGVWVLVGVVLVGEEVVVGPLVGLVGPLVVDVGPLDADVVTSGDVADDAPVDVGEASEVVGEPVCVPVVGGLEVVLVVALVEGEPPAAVGREPAARIWPRLGVPVAPEVPTGVPRADPPGATLNDTCPITPRPCSVK